MKPKSDISKHIIEALKGKIALRKADLYEALSHIAKQDSGSQMTKYAVNRAIKDLVEGDYIEEIESDSDSYFRLTKAGKKKASSSKLDSKNALLSSTWDGKWRIILLDLPEKRKAERESLRYLLKKAGFVCLKNSAWISPYPFEHLFLNIKSDLGLSKEMIIFVTDKVDELSEKYFFNEFSK